MSPLPRSTAPTLAAIAVALPPTLSLLLGGRAAEADREPPATVISLLCVEVQAALPLDLREAFRVVDGEGFVLVQHNARRASSAHECEDVQRAERALIGAAFAVWPGQDGRSLEVSRLESPHFTDSTPQGCGVCGGEGNEVVL